MKKESPPSHEPHVRAGRKIILVVSVFIPFTLLISLGNPELFLTPLFIAIPTIFSIYWLRSLTSVITTILMIIITLYLK